MSDGFKVLGYSTDDGSETEQVWNSREGTVPHTITLRSGSAAWHAGPDVYHGPGWTPPAGMRVIVDWMPGMGESGGVEIGWPGMPYLLDPGA
jgi:hypothetical protein